MTELYQRPTAWLAMSLLIVVAAPVALVNWVWGQLVRR